MLISRKIGWLVLLVLSSNALSGMQGFAYTTFRRTPQLTEGTVLERTIFEEVDFSNLNVENMGFNDCVFRECIFTRAKLRKVIFNNCKFYSCVACMTKFDDSIFESCTIYGLHSTGYCSLAPDGNKIKGSRKLSLNKNSPCISLSLRNATLLNTTIGFTCFVDLDLTGATIGSSDSPVLIRNCEIMRATFTNSKFEKAYLYDSRVWDYDPVWLQRYGYVRLIRDSGLTMLSSNVMIWGVGAICLPVGLIGGFLVIIPGTAKMISSGKMISEKAVDEAIFKNCFDINKIITAKDCVCVKVEGIDSEDKNFLSTLGTNFNASTSELNEILKKNGEQTLRDIASIFGAPGEATVSGLFFLYQVAFS